jgi:tetratricopeptide (TPR) repeat protein
MLLCRLLAARALLTALLAIAWACGGRTADISGALETIPRADLTTADPLVREQILVARERLEALVEQEAEAGRLASAFGEMGQIYHAYDLLEPAAASYRNANRSAPGYRWLYYLGLVYEREGRLEEAFESFREALSRRPGDAPALFHLGQIELDRNRPKAARSRFLSALEGAPDCHAARFGLGEVARALGDDAEAAEHFSRVLEEQPDADQVRYPLAQTLMRLGRRAEADQQLLRVASREHKVGGRPYCPDPLDRELGELRTGAAVYLRLGLAARLAGNSEQELELYRRAVEIAPVDAVARERLGAALFQQGDSEAARAQYEEAVRLAPDKAALRSGLGVVLTRLGSLAEAESHFRRALELHPASNLYRFQLATAMQRMERCDEAIWLYSQILKIEPPHREARLQRAVCLVRTGRGQEAARDLGTLLDLHPPEDPTEHLRLASMLLSLEDDQRALRHFVAIAESEASSEIKARAHLLIGQVRLRHGDRPGAEQSFSAAIELDPTLRGNETLLRRPSLPPSP